MIRSDTNKKNNCWQFVVLLAERLRHLKRSFVKANIQAMIMIWPLVNMSTVVVRTAGKIELVKVVQSLNVVIQIDQLLGDQLVRDTRIQECIVCSDDGTERSAKNK